MSTFINDTKYCKWFNFFYGYIQIHVYPNNGYFIARFIELVIKHMCQQIHTQIE